MILQVNENLHKMYFQQTKALPYNHQHRSGGIVGELPRIEGTSTIQFKIHQQVSLIQLHLRCLCLCSSFTANWADLRLKCSKCVCEGTNRGLNGTNSKLSWVWLLFHCKLAPLWHRQSRISIFNQRPWLIIHSFIFLEGYHFQHKWHNYS